MSIWTHVVGTIRVDGIPGISKLEKLKEILGEIYTWDDLADLEDDIEGETTLPMGSEGSLRYQVIEYDTGMRWAVIPIWGDLRDYDDVAYIEEWWNRVISDIHSTNTKDFLGIVRDGCLRIEVEGQKPVLLWTKEQ
jgi:hypothetical protein